MAERKLFIMTITIAGILFLLSAVSADTWQLAEDGQFQSIEQRDKFNQAVAGLKQLAEQGDIEQFQNALDGLYKDFPEVAGTELDAFMEAELFFCEGNFEKAFRTYDVFLNRFGESNLYEAALERQFAIGSAYLQGRKKKIMERIADRAGDSPVAQRALKAVAQSYENRKKYEQAYMQWSIISSRWPTGAIGKEALLGMAESKHAAYRGPRFDNSSLKGAKSYYERFKLLYPEDAKELEIDKRLDLIEEQLAYKKFHIGKYYQRTSDGRADANQPNPIDIYYNAVLKNWPKSVAAKMTEEAMQSEKETEGKVKE
jgi:outer membrane protein assembly factor BamD (BamD/ComL family)